ncbi:MAG: HYR domain-containing protein [Verrucomicrobia bacterium]|nr:HYR domain-containing protein [Verrucomicrobiota bacterium]
MKTFPTSLSALMCAAVVSVLAPASYAYTFTLQPGYNLVANHLDIPAGNNVSQVFASGPPPDFSSIWRWQPASQSFLWEDYFYSGIWSLDPLLDPGDGQVFYLPGATPVSFTVSGLAPISPPVVALAPGQFQLLGNATPTADTAPGTYDDLVGTPPPGGMTAWLMRWDALAQTFLAYRHAGGTWNPIVPAVPVGEAAFVAVFAAGSPAPNLVSAGRGCDAGGDFIRVTFDASVDPVSASAPANFSLGGPGLITAAVAEYQPPWPLPQPVTRSVLLRVTGLAPGLLTVSAPGVMGLDGTSVQGVAQLQTALVPVSISFDCDRGLLCLEFNQALDPTAALFAGNYAVTWTDLGGGGSGSLGINYLFLGSSGPQSNSLTRVCLSVPLPPPGNLLFTVTLNPPLVSACGVPLASAPFTISTKCNPVITGTVFRHQSPPECAQDLGTSLYGTLPNEFGLVGNLVKLTDGLNVFYAGTDANGDFRLNAPPGSYTLSLQAPPGWTQECPLGGADIPLTLAPGSSYPGNLFSASPTVPVNDLSVFLYSRSQFPPYRSPCCGFDTTLVANYRNTGTEVILGTTVVLVLPPAALAAFVSSTEVPLLPAPFSASPAPVGGVITWLLPPLAPGQSGQLEAKVTLTCPVGSLNTVIASATITTPPGDPTPADNTSAYSRQTTCSVDPNDKTVRPAGCGPDGLVPVGTEFEYFIQFQNTGSGPAYQVVLHDPLDPDLDPSTVQLLGGSHPFVCTFNPLTSELVWTMEGIELPGASYDEPHSHGWVRFKVQHLAVAPAGTVITNQAAIYFDLNPPVLTATTKNTLSTSPQPVAAFTVAPVSPTAGQPVNFTYTGGTGGATFAWNFGPGAIPPTSTAPNPAGIIFTTPGSHTVGLEVRLGDCVAPPASQVVMVGPPTIHCPGDITTRTDAGQCSAIVAFTAMAGANSPAVTIACSPPSGSAFSKGMTTVNCTATDAFDNTASCSFTVTVEATEDPGHLFPIALNAQTLAGVTPGSVIPDIFNGTQPGSFGWLTWAGSPNAPTLAVSLTPPGNSSTYVNPANAGDHVVSVGDWVQGAPGVANSSSVRQALDTLKTIDINVPIWDQTSGKGSNTKYRVVGFAKVRILNYQLPGPNRITARYLGAACP